MTVFCGAETYEYVSEPFKAFLFLVSFLFSLRFYEKSVLKPFLIRLYFARSEDGFFSNGIIAGGELVARCVAAVIHITSEDDWPCLCTLSSTILVYRPIFPLSWPVSPSSANSIRSLRKKTKRKKQRISFHYPERIQKRPSSFPDIVFFFFLFNLLFF